MSKLKNKYLFVHEENDIHFLFILLNGLAFSHPLFKAHLGLPNFYNHGMIFKQGTERWFAEAKMFNAVSKAVFRRVSASDSFKRKIISASETRGQRLYAECYCALKEINEHGLTLERSLGIFEFYWQLCALGLGAVMSDLEHHYLSRQLDKIVSSKISQHKLRRSLGEYIGVMVQSPPSVYALSAKKELLNLAKKKGSRDHLEDYLARYCWLNFGHHGPALNLAALKLQIQKIRQDKKKLSSLKAAADVAGLRSLQARYAKELRLKPSEKRFFDAARDFNGIKAYRADLMSLTYYALGLGIEKLARQRHIKARTLYNLTPNEFINFLRTKKLPSASMLERRWRKSVCLIRDFRTVDIWIGRAADNFVKNRLPATRETAIASEVSGFVASPGRVSGRVKIIRSAKDIHKVKIGDILVAGQTMPQYLPAMGRAAAFVTNLGGITSHAAIVAREMKKPCVIGTKIATKIFKDNDLVEVDAEKGRVRKIAQL